jgi:hypothetical protein
MTDLEAIADAYVALWNETDERARLRRLREGWAEDAAYADPIMAASGHAGISGLVAGVHQQFPQFRFTRLGKAEALGDKGRFRWGLGPEGAEPLIEGTDFVTIADGRLTSVTGFLDKVPG